MGGQWCVCQALLQDVHCPYALGQFMPPFPPGLSEWLPSGLVTVLFGWLFYEVKAIEARQEKRIDELRADMKEGFAQCRAEQRADNKAMAERLDRLVEGLLAAKQT